MYNDVIGLIGGFGAYATLNFYKRILEVFSTGCERDYPRIIMDNNFTMPSRTRALLYDEGKEEIVRDIVKSVELLENSGANKIIMVCGTAHYFLEDVLGQLQKSNCEIYNIIENLVIELNNKSVKKVLILAAEGALYKNVYDGYLKKRNINYIKPSTCHYEKIRYFIECVKCNKITNEVRKEFLFFIKEFCQDDVKDVVLGCTEFPILVNSIIDDNINTIQNSIIGDYRFWDPLEVSLELLKKQIN